jgi:hypothetical protein
LAKEDQSTGSEKTAMEAERQAKTIADRPIPVNFISYIFIQEMENSHKIMGLSTQFQVDFAIIVAWNINLIWTFHPDKTLMSAYARLETRI